MQQAEKYTNERHHTYATFLFRDVRRVSRLTGKSNVTKEVHGSGMTSCTAHKRGNWAQKPHFSEAANKKQVFMTWYVRFHCSQVQMHSNKLTSYITDPVTQGESGFNVFDLKRVKETCCAAYITSPLRTTSRATSSNFVFGSANSVSALVTAVMYAYTTDSHSLISPTEIGVRQSHNMGTIVLLFGVQTCTVTTGHVFSWRPGNTRFHWMRSMTVHNRDTKSASHNSEFPQPAQQHDCDKEDRGRHPRIQTG